MQKLMMLFWDVGELLAYSFLGFLHRQGRIILRKRRRRKKEYEAEKAKTEQTNEETAEGREAWDISGRR
jgi:hypothetical protein